MGFFCFLLPKMLNLYMLVKNLFNFFLLLLLLIFIFEKKNQSSAVPQQKKVFSEEEEPHQVSLCCAAHCQSPALHEGEPAVFVSVWTKELLGTFSVLVFEWIRHEQMCELSYCRPSVRQWWSLRGRQKRWVKCWMKPIHACSTKMKN